MNNYKNTSVEGAMDYFMISLEAKQLDLGNLRKKMGLELPRNEKDTIESLISSVDNRFLVNLFFESLQGLYNKLYDDDCYCLISLALYDAVRRKDDITKKIVDKVKDEIKYLTGADPPAFSSNRLVSSRLRQLENLFINH